MFNPLVVSTLAIWVLVAIVLWFAIKNLYGGRPSDVVIPLWLVIVVVTVWPLAFIASAVVLAILGLWAMLRFIPTLFGGKA